MSAIAGSARWSASVLGNTMALLLLAALAFAFLRWHEGNWWLAMPLPQRWAWATASLLAYGGSCAWILRRAALRDAAEVPGSSIDADTVWVIHASQTGFAAQLADMTASTLAGAGMHTQRMGLEHLDADRMASISRALFVVSTTGEGDPPDPALRFVRDTMAQAPSLAHLHYAVLALGDREYAQFCAFGHQLDDWLRQHGAHSLFDRVEVDNADDAALRHWQHHLGHLSGSPDLPDWSPPRYEHWRLTERTLLNPGSQGGAAFHIALSPSQEGATDWKAGDIVEIGPRHAPHIVQAFLESLSLTGDTIVTAQGEQHTLGMVVSRSHLPSGDGLRGLSAQSLADTLSPLPHREYSIASLPADGGLHLLVRLMTRPDGSPGLGSGWLCRHASIGDDVALRIRSNANFHAPPPSAPMILIGNGTGLAGLRAHLKARARAGATRNWLLFGERNAESDFFHRDEILQWQTQGQLTRLDLAFSRDQPQRRYVQHVLAEHADELCRWIAEGAALYVCGSLEGMAPGVDAVLRQALGDDTVEQLLAEGRYRRDVY